MYKREWQTFKSYLAFKEGDLPCTALFLSSAWRLYECDLTPPNLMASVHPEGVILQGSLRRQRRISLRSSWGVTSLTHETQRMGRVGLTLYHRPGCHRPIQKKGCPSAQKDPALSASACARQRKAATAKRSLLPSSRRQGKTATAKALSASAWLRHASSDRDREGSRRLKADVQDL